MAKKIVATGTSLVITDSATSAVEYEQPLKHLWFDAVDLDATPSIIRINPMNDTIKKGYKVLLSEAIDEDDVSFTVESWREWARWILCSDSIVTVLFGMGF